MRAYILVREQPWYRRTAFLDGLKRAGCSVQLGHPSKIDADTLLVIWNRYAGNHEIATMVERGGGKVLVAENGYLGEGGGTPKFQVHPAGPQPGHYYAVSPRFHNDHTTIVPGDSDRFSALGATLKPWREAGDHILVCPNRSFGVPDRMMPPDWAEKTAAYFRKHTKRPVKIRAHPGNNAPARSLAEDLLGAWAVVIWSSSCGVHALAEGIPVVVFAPYWIMRGAGSTGAIEALTVPDRRPHFERLAWGQWTCAEIERGDPFAHMLSAARQG